MPMPNNGLITETNRQYYEGAQGFYALDSITTNFNTDLVFYTYDPNEENYPLNNFKLYASNSGLPGTYTEYTEPYTVENNKITFQPPFLQLYYIVQLKSLSGGNYGNQDAYGTTVEENYGGYQYVKLSEIVNNFVMAYVGNGKLIPDVKRTDVIFHAKRAMQEFSYDTLKSIKSQELTVPPSLSVVIPQDYVNYVKISWVDGLGRKHPIYPANNLTSNPTEAPLQDDRGIEMQDQFNNNIETDPIIEDRWGRANINAINGTYFTDTNNDKVNDYGYGFADGGYIGLGRQYGLDPQYSQLNGWFTINNRENKISFSSNLREALIVLDYVSDGLAYDLDSRVPKMAEEAMYAYILHAIVATRASSPEYLVQRLKQEKSAKLRNTKIRLSNIKLEEITQVLRGQSKWIKH